MSSPSAPGPSQDVKIRWVDVLFTPCRGANKVRDEERSKPPAERAEVFGIDLHSTSVHSAMEWAKHFRDGLGPDDPPACVIAYGREITPHEQVQLALAGIHALDVFREDLKLQGPSHGMLIDLLRTVMARSAVASTPRTPQPVPPPSPLGDWDLYTTQPNQVPVPALNALFDELARDDRPWWERDA